MYKIQEFLVILKRNIELMKLVILVNKLKEIKYEETHSSHKPSIELGSMPILKNIIWT